MRLGSCRNSGVVISYFGRGASPAAHTRAGLFVTGGWPQVGRLSPHRAGVALAVRARYGGDGDSEAARAAARLTEPEAVRRASLLGLALRLGHTITGGAPGLFDDISLRLDARGLMLTFSSRNQVLMGEAARRRLDALAAALGRAAIVEVAS